MTQATVRPGNYLAQVLARAKGEHVAIGKMNAYLVKHGKVNATDKTGAYLGDIKKYDGGIVERFYDTEGHLASAALVNWAMFNSDGQNVKSAWRNARKGRGGLSDINVSSVAVPTVPLLLTDDVALNDALTAAALAQ